MIGSNQIIKMVDDWNLGGASYSHNSKTGGIEIARLHYPSADQIN